MWLYCWYFNPLLRHKITCNSSLHHDGQAVMKVFIHRSPTTSYILVWIQKLRDTCRIPPSHLSALPRLPWDQHPRDSWLSCCESLQKSLRRQQLLLPSADRSSLPTYLHLACKTSLVNTSEIPKNFWAGTSCCLRCSERCAEGMDYYYFLNQALRFLDIILVAHSLLSASGFLFLKKPRCPKQQMDQIVGDFAYLIAMKDDYFLNTFRLLFSYSSHQL